MHARPTTPTTTRWHTPTPAGPPSISWLPSAQAPSAVGCLSHASTALERALSFFLSFLSRLSPRPNWKSSRLNNQPCLPRGMLCRAVPCRANYTPRPVPARGARRGQSARSIAPEVDDGTPIVISEVPRGWPIHREPLSRSRAASAAPASGDTVAEVWMRRSAWRNGCSKIDWMKCAVECATAPASPGHRKTVLPCGSSRSRSRKTPLWHSPSTCQDRSPGRRPA